MNELIFYGILYSFALSALIFIILLLKKLLHKILLPKGQYRIWLALSAAAAVPFFPTGSLHFLHTRNAAPITGEPAATTVSEKTAASFGAIKDFAVSTDHGIPPLVFTLLLILWAAGAVVMLTKLFYQLWQARNLRLSALPIKNSLSTALFCQCQKQLGIHRSVFLGETAECHIPAALGIFHRTVLLPANYKTGGLKYMLLHELAHHKGLDPLTNLFLQIFKALNWFNPAVHAAVKQINLDRELACDSRVLEILADQEIRSYGQALLSFISERPSGPVLGLTGGSGQLRKRIVRIAGYQKETPVLKRISIFLVLILIALTFTLVPPASALMEQKYEPDQPLTIYHEDLSAYFGALKGSFVLYDKSEDRYTIYNETAARTRVSPNSTYKIYSGLLALESGIISKDHSALDWDGRSYPFDEWNRDQTLFSAMQNSVNWYFQRLDQNMGKAKLQRFYESIGYGNCNLSAGVNSYWLESSLKISPLEQVRLLAGLYDNEWKLDPANVQTIQKAITLSSDSHMLLAGKTGTGNTDGRDINGWFVGYVKTSAGLYFFATNIQGADGASGNRAAKITKRILAEKELLL